MITKRICIHCKRIGVFGFTSCWYGKPGQWECANRTMCLRRQHEARNSA